MRPAVVASFVALVACSPAAPPPLNCLCARWERASALTGAFDVRILALRTLDGPEVHTTTLGSVTAQLDRTETAITGSIGDARWLTRVDSNVALVPSSGGCCPGPWAAADSQPTDWRDRDGVRVDTLDELGGALAAFAPSLLLDGPAAFDANELADVVVREVDATGMTVTSVYVVRASDCADASCASRVVVTYRFDRREI